MRERERDLSCFFARIDAFSPCIHMQTIPYPQQATCHKCCLASARRTTAERRTLDHPGANLRKRARRDQAISGMLLKYLFRVRLRGPLRWAGPCHNQ